MEKDQKLDWTAHTTAVMSFIAAGVGFVLLINGQPIYAIYLTLVAIFLGNL